MEAGLSDACNLLDDLVMKRALVAKPAIRWPDEAGIYGKNQTLTAAVEPGSEICLVVSMESAPKSYSFITEDER